MQTTPKPSCLMRRCEVMQWLGVERDVIEKWVRCGFIRRLDVPGCKGFYYRDEIESKILNGNGNK